MSDVFTTQERDSARPPADISSQEWGERNRELSVLTSASAGRWSLAAVPFMAPVLEALDDEEVEMVVLQKSSQVAGTETFLTWQGKCADQDPGPAMMCFADEDTAKEVVERRLMPMMRTSPPLARLIEASKFNKESITLLNNYSLTPAWASSIGKTASRPIRYLYCSEITKPGYGKMGAEGAVISRIIQRTETFPNKKLAFESSPTIEGDNLDQVMNLCEARFDWHVPCPHCGVFQVLRFRPTKYRNDAGEERMSGGVVWDDQPQAADKATSARLAGETARYECGECKSRWTTAEKNAAVSRGKAVSREPINRKPKRVGIYISRLYSLFPGGRLESLVESFLLAKDSPDELQVFINNALGEHWKRHKITHTEDELRAAETDIEFGIVPDAADCIIVTTDMQQAGFWYLVRAWQAALKQSWLIECGQLATWDDLSDLIFERTWAKKDGESFGVWRAGIDIGGTKDEESLVSRTEEAYDWYIQNHYRARRRMYLCKGSSRSMPTKVNVGKILETTPSGKKINRYGLQVLELNTPVLKRLFQHGIKQAIEKGSQAAYLHKDMPPQYYRHITAEAENDQGEFERLRKDNHWFDCEAMQHGLISREIEGGIDLLARWLAENARKNQPKTAPEAPKTEEKPQEKQEKQPDFQPQKPVKQRKPAYNPWTRGTRFG